MGVSICCSYADLGVARDLVAVLGHRGLVSDVVADVDRDDDALVMQLVGDKGPTIYVLLASESFESERVQVLVTLFGAHRQSTHRLQIIEVDEDDVEAMATTIEDAVKESAKRATRTAMERVSSSGVREPTSGGGDAKPRPTRSPPIEDPNPLRDRVGAIPSRIRTFGGSTRAAAEPKRAAPPARAAASPSESPSELVRPPSWPTPAAVRGASEIDAVERLPVVSEENPMGVPFEPPSESDSAAEPEERDTVDGLSAVDEDLDEGAEASAVAPRRTSRMGLYIGAAVAVAAAVALLVLLPSDPAPPSFAAATVAPSQGNEPGEPKSGADGEGPSAQAGTEKGAASPSPAAVKPGPKVQPEVAPEEPKAADEPKVAEEPEAAEEARAPALPPPPILTTSDAELSRQIAAALDTKRIRAIDNLLVFRSTNHEDVEFSESARLCRVASVNRIRGWRLPSIVELRKIRRARLIPRQGWFWSRSAAKAEDGKAGRWVLTRRSHRPKAVLRTEQAQTVCIRER